MFKKETVTKTGFIEGIGPDGGIRHTCTGWTAAGSVDVLVGETDQGSTGCGYQL